MSPIFWQLEAQQVSRLYPSVGDTLTPQLGCSPSASGSVVFVSGFLGAGGTWSAPAAHLELHQARVLSVPLAHGDTASGWKLSSLVKTRERIKIEAQ